MKFLITLLSAAALLASGISASPLGERGLIKARAVPTTNYDIDKAIAHWMKERHTRHMFVTAGTTTGGWESWAQLELEQVFKNKFKINQDTDIREQSKVFNKLPKASHAKIADFVLPQTDDYKGMIIELKCENKKTNRGDHMQKPVLKDIDKGFQVKDAYSHYTFVALVMAYTDEAQEALTDIGLKPIKRAEHIVKDIGTMRVYRKDTPSAQQYIDGMTDLTEAFENLFFEESGKTTTGSDKTTTGSASGKTTTGSGKTTTGSASGKTTTGSDKKTTASAKTTTGSASGKTTTGSDKKTTASGKKTTASGKKTTGSA
ncbi:hypothetical protein K504DRAFT_465665 [Pleomassaria siparia CBS 279.74]|uniref:YqaJ viral recombinase domain-containing protein n=1 Tax=Pleomassaria siparia CBS 279.74 TaxID=1314801 RepID=A0A6G1KGN9_9PLEO|nr:hypothetical protein K504DRAFT_465665 [Pleomassaria siparia CBS 279.74]